MVSQDFAKAGANMYTFHLEAVADVASLNADEAHPDVVAVAQEIRQAGMHVGVAVKPDTPVELLLPYLNKKLLDMVRLQPICMSIMTANACLPGLSCCCGSCTHNYGQ